MSTSCHTHPTDNQQNSNLKPSKQTVNFQLQFSKQVEEFSSIEIIETTTTTTKKRTKMDPKELKQPQHPVAGRDNLQTDASNTSTPKNPDNLLQTKPLVLSTSLKTEPNQTPSDVTPCEVAKKLCDDEDWGGSSASKQDNPKRPLINVPLIPIKIILFSWYAAGACLLPYMTLHMKQLGLTMVEMTAVYAILPIIQLFGTPIAGFIADRTGNYKSVLLFTLTTCIFTTFLLQFFVPARSPRDSTQPNTADQEVIPEPFYMVTFWLYLVIRIFHQVAVGLTYVLLDSTTLVLAERHNSNYGRQRFWAILATGLFSPICGAVIDQISKNRDPSGAIIYNYDPAFYFFNSLTAITLFKATKIEVEVAALPKNVWSDVRKLLKSANVWIFLFSVFIMGSCWGFLESFLFIHLEKLSAPTFLLGLTVTVGSLIGLPFLYGSEWFMKKVGATRLLLLALVVYFIRLIGYSLLENPWWCIPYELMEAFTLHLMWVSTVRLAYQISPPGMLATMQAIVGGLNFGVGRGFGSLVGGAVMVVYDIRSSFRVLGCMALGTALIWGMLDTFVLSSLEEHDKKKSAIDMNTRRQDSKDMEAGNSEVKNSSLAKI